MRSRWFWFISGMVYIAGMQIIRPDKDYTLAVVMLYAAMLLTGRGKE